MANILQFQEEAAAEQEANRARAIPLVVPNWNYAAVGDLVKRSAHFLKENTYQRLNMPPMEEQVGIITQLKQYKDDLCGMVTWPHIHWQGETSSSMCHPLNATLVGRTDLPTITMNSNQQV